MSKDDVGNLPLTMHGVIPEEKSFTDTKTNAFERPTFSTVSPIWNIDMYIHSSQTEVLYSSASEFSINSKIQKYPQVEIPENGVSPRSGDLIW